MAHRWDSSAIWCWGDRTYANSDNHSAFKSGDRDMLKSQVPVVSEANTILPMRLPTTIQPTATSVWRDLRQITNYKLKHLYFVNYLHLANNLNWVILLWKTWGQSWQHPPKATTNKLTLATTAVAEASALTIPFANTLPAFGWKKNPKKIMNNIAVRT